MIPHRTAIRLYRNQISKSPRSTHLLLKASCVLEGDLVHFLGHLTALLPLLNHSYLLWGMCPPYDTLPQFPIHITQKTKVLMSTD